MGTGAETRQEPLDAGREWVFQHTAPVTSYLGRDNMGLADLVPPVASSHRDDGQLSQDDGPTDGSGYFLGALDTQTDMSVVIPDGNKRLEPGPLASTGLRVSGDIHALGLPRKVRKSCRESGKWKKVLDSQVKVHPPGEWKPHQNLAIVLSVHHPAVQETWV